MADVNIWPALQIATTVVIALVGWWNWTLQTRMKSSEDKADAAAGQALAVERALAAHKLFVAENYTKISAQGQLEERIDKRLENIEGMVRNLVANRHSGAGGE